MLFRSMCGTFGDPISSEYIKELVDICVERQLAVRIHTNGSVKTVNWWQELANKLKSVDHAVVFGIDGLADTHEIHRQGTNFNKIMSNAQAFILAGGNGHFAGINPRSTKPTRLSYEYKFLPFSLTQVYAGRTAQALGATDHIVTDATADRKSTRLNSSHTDISRMPSSA